MSVTGPDRLTWLNSITSQALDRLAPGESSETLILDPQGRIEYDAHVLDDGVTTWLLVDRVETTGLLAWLDRMRFMLRVEVADRTEEFATIGTMATDAAAIGLEVAAPNGVPAGLARPVVGDRRRRLAVRLRRRAPGRRLELQRGARAARVAGDLAERAASGSPALAGTLALEALRIAAWRPRFATEVDERTIPHELDWLRSAVHLDKGCYRGQETVAKVHNLGHPPRRLVMLHLDGSDTVLPAHGDEVFAERKRPEPRPAGARSARSRRAPSTTSSDRSRSP